MHGHTIFNGYTENNKHDLGTGFAVNTHLVGQIINFKPVNHLINSLRIKGKWHQGMDLQKTKKKVLKINLMSY